MEQAAMQLEAATPAAQLRDALRDAIRRYDEAWERLEPVQSQEQMDAVWPDVECAMDDAAEAFVRATNDERNRSVALHDMSTGGTWLREVVADWEAGS